MSEPLLSEARIAELAHIANRAYWDQHAKDGSIKPGMNPKSIVEHNMDAIRQTMRETAQACMQIAESLAQGPIERAQWQTAMEIAARISKRIRNG